MVFGQTIAHINKWRHLCWYLAKLDINQRYRRSTLGRWWNVLSIAVTLLTLSYIWSNIFKLDLSTYLLYFSVSYLLWQTISGIINEGASAFIGAESLIKQEQLPLMLHIWRIGIRNMLILVYNMIVVVGVYVYFDSWPGAALLALPLSLLLMMVFLFGFITLLAIFSVRYRDAPPLISNVMQIIFFVTPIMWKPTSLPEKMHWVLDYNILLLYLDLVRLPLLGQIPSIADYMLAAGIAFLVLICALYAMARYRRHIPYWI